MESTFLMENSLYDDDTLLPETKDNISLSKLIAKGQQDGSERVKSLATRY